MKLMVMDAHEGYGVFPLFKKGTVVENLCSCKDYPHWLSCNINGQETFVPDTYVANELLIKDYNPTELIIQKGQTVTLLAIVFAWVYVKDETNKTGWLPANKVASINS